MKSTTMAGSSKPRLLVLALVLTFSCFPVAAATYTAPPDQVNLPIPPFGGTGASNGPVTMSRITVPLSAYETITDVNVHLDLAHTFDSDLVISLVTPNGIEVLLANRRGGAGDNYTGTIFDDQALSPISAGAPPFPGALRPEQALTFNPPPLAGVWTLQIQDVAEQDTGTLLSWALEISTVTNQVPTRRNPQWTANYPGQRIAADGFLGPQKLGRCFLTAGATLHVFTSETNTPSNGRLWFTVLGSISPLALAPFAGGADETIFAPAQNGYLYNINGLNGSNPWLKDLRRQSCISDSLTAAPVVQTYATANAEFRSVFAGMGFAGQDIVFVGTDHQCSDTVGNRIYAFSAVTAQTAWVFNDAGIDIVDRVMGLALDSASNTLFCTCAHVGVPSVYAINTLNGDAKWSAAVGDVRTKPVFAGNRIYVATYDGHLVALNAVTGNQIWTFTVTAANIYRDIEYVPEHQIILVTDSAGLVHGVDVSAMPEEAWPAPFLPYGVTTSARHAKGTTKFYVGGPNGKITQCDLLTGEAEVTLTVGANFVTDLIVDSNTGLVGNRLLVSTSGGPFTRFYIPFDVQWPDGRSSGFTSSDLSVEPTPGTNLVAVGQQFTYGFNVFNNRFDPFSVAVGDEVRPVFVTNTVPAGLFLNSVSVSQGTYAISTNRIIVNLDEMTNNAMATITVNVTATNAGVFPNVARVATTDPSYLDAEPANDVSSSTLTIVDPAVTPIVSINAASVLEGNSDPTPMVFPVRLSAASYLPVSVDYGTFSFGMTADANVDYASTNRTLVFNPGETNRTVTVTVFGDTLSEGNEFLLVLLGNPTNAFLSSTQSFAAGTIVDDDGPVLLHIARDGTNVLLSWSTNIVGFTLQAAPELLSGDWDQVYPAPLVVGDQNVVTNNVGLSQRYYRLKK